MLWKSEETRERETNRDIKIVRNNNSRTWKEKCTVDGEKQSVKWYRAPTPSASSNRSCLLPRLRKETAKCVSCLDPLYWLWSLLLPVHIDTESCCQRQVEFYCCLCLIHRRRFKPRDVEKKGGTQTELLLLVDLCFFFSCDRSKLLLRRQAEKESARSEIDRGMYNT